ncbi:MAG: HEAT repeat domain-containing protein [Candidatus Cloacimonetes bacterium]|nr:HEAT repeat domain-containing protein [Candidatus Cloacimonadota bacterium]
MKKLAKYLNDGNDAQKLQAVKKLAQLKTKEAGKILYDAFKKEPNQEIKNTIKKGIDYIKQNLTSPTEDNTPKPLDEATIDSIIDAYQSGDATKEKKALEFMIKRQANELIPELIDFAEERDDADFIVRAIRVCARLNNQNYSAELSIFYSHESPLVIHEVMQYQEQKNTIANNLKTLNSFLFHSSKKISENALRLITEESKGGNEIAVSLLNDYEQELIKRQRAAVPNFVPTEVDPDLLPSKKSDKDAVKKKKAASQSKEKLAFYKIKNSLDSDVVSERIEAIDVISKSKDPEAIDLIYQKLGTETDESVLESSLHALGLLKAESALSSITGYMEHENSKLRYAAAKAMNSILGLEKTKPAMVALLNDSDVHVKSIAIQGLFASKPNECFLPLSALTDPKDLNKSLCCMDCLEIFQDDKHLTMMHKFFHSPLPEVKDRAKNILSNWKGDPDVANFILEDSDANFTQFYKNHLAKVKIKQAKAEQEEELQEDSEESVTQDQEKGSFFSSILKKFKK